MSKLSDAGVVAGMLGVLMLWFVAALASLGLPIILIYYLVTHW